MLTEQEIRDIITSIPSPKYSPEMASYILEYYSETDMNPQDIHYVVTTAYDNPKDVAEAIANTWQIVTMENLGDFNINAAKSLQDVLSYFNVGKIFCNRALVYVED